MEKRGIPGFACVFVLSLAWGCSGSQEGLVAVPEGSRLELSELVGQMRDMAWAEEVDAAQALIEEQRHHHDESGPEWLLAASWLGRGASFAERWDVAEQYAREAYNGSQVLLRGVVA